MVEGFCVDYCGDGRRFTADDVELFQYNACDDGNQAGTDGCSSICDVEPNFACHGGGSKTADKCLEVIPPTATLSQLDDQAFQIDFSELVTLTSGDASKMEDYLSVKVICGKTLILLNATNVRLTFSP